MMNHHEVPGLRFVRGVYEHVPVPLPHPASTAEIQRAMRTRPPLLTCMKYHLAVDTAVHRYVGFDPTLPPNDKSVAGPVVVIPVIAGAFEPVDVVDVLVEKLAVTVVEDVKLTEQVPVPEQPPPAQPVNVEPALGAAFNVRERPFA